MSTSHVLGALASLAGGLSVLLGAFGAHALKNKIEPALLTAYNTAVAYQMVHAVAVLVIVLLARTSESPGLYHGAAVSMLSGILLFSGSLYALTLLGWRWFGPITPLGGLLLMMGWVLLLVAMIRSNA
ncbi:MAG: hypothetical protein CMQ05_17055 [Gammaproteobacteria bacterium]|uniref:DUF423 domain-containing protein n=1 Tax=OM182 bacterium MED-G24 TaxID=1986255 RepID=A0A2A5X068_9GAMM|nr:hypothetical protein [Gammaproteobacteria bacterium]PDH42180.1 MAG: hypothetical protein CNE99_00220 [OM182 bacterium MED-G24]RPG23212.1 MAG: DUF423 domain-containing protein [Gammaproteobacteria bacterium TMED50]